MPEQTVVVKCDMDRDCKAPVTHIDNKGYSYCAEHAAERKFWKPTRKLRTWELARMMAGKCIAYKIYSKAQFIQQYGA